MPKHTKSSKALDLTLDEVRVKTRHGWRKLKSSERAGLVRMMSVRVPDQPFDVMRLAPRGSFLARMLRHFDETDISYSMPLMSTVMFAASWLTQNGAHLAVPGIGTIRPTLWNVGLAESGSSKTLASEEVAAILSDGDEPPVSFLPPPQSAPQWIIDLSEQNGAFWFQDEVGKLFQAIFTQSNMVQLKPWMLFAYSHQSISNRLKSEEVKLRIDRPAFTFHGLTVLETWPTEIDMSSMLDGFCQRMNYYIAEPRTDTDMYDHFLYFAGEAHDARRAQLRDLWHALCAQENAGGAYTLDDDALPYVNAWWKSLRETWGRSDLPRSFIRRIGFATLRYLPVLQFLLGKSRHPIDVETAELATRFAEYHFRSALTLIQRYDAGATNKVQRIADVSRRLAKDGKPVTKRNVIRTLSRAQRAEFGGEEIAAILDAFSQVEPAVQLFGKADHPHANPAALRQRHDALLKRLDLNERKRNERRVREMLSRWRAALPEPSHQADDADKIVPINLPRTGTGG